MRSRTPGEQIEWAVAARCRPGEVTTGDLAVVDVRRDATLVAGIDGLGHGREASQAARRAAEAIRHRPGDDLVTLTWRCHQALRGTRGAALSLACLSCVNDELTWLGIGNVEGRLISGAGSAGSLRASLVLASGVPGHELPRVRPETVPVRAGDIVIIATDGVLPTFADALDISGSAEEISERVLANHWKRPDDALVVTVRYLGRRS